MNLHSAIQSHPRLKRWVLHFLMHPVKARPQWWIRLFIPLYIKRGRYSVIYRSVRKDIVPFRRFVLGAYSVVEDYATINNAVGDVIIGHHCRIGLHNTVIGPVKLGNHVDVAQGVTLSGLNHNYEKVDRPISQQGVSTQPITISNDVWIGANAVILAGSTIGQHCVVAAGAVVNGDVPDFCLVAGTPARIIKRYRPETGNWEKELEPIR